jgi:hypothetical protein
MTSPSVGVDLHQKPVIAYTRITWEWDYSVYYAHKFTEEWTRINLAQGTHPSIKVGGNEVHIVWEYPGSEIYHVWGAIGSNDVNWLSSPTNISESPDHSSRYPTIIEHNHVLWSEEVSPGLSQIYCNHFYFHKKHDVFKWRVPGDINGVNSGVNELFPQACPGQILFGEDATYGERHYVFTVDDGDGKYGVKHIVDTVLVSHLIAVMSGPVADDTTWETGTVVLVVGDLTIEPSVTLEIEPGVTVLVTKEDGEQGGLDVSRTEIIVSGTLIARGEITDGDTGRIEFTSLDTLGAAGDWYGIRFENASVGSLVYCDVECAEKGIESSGDLRIEGCDIRNNVVGIEVDGGSIVARAKVDGGSIVARANRIIENDSIGVLTHVGQNINFGDLANADTTDDGANRIYDNGIWDAYNASPGTPLMQGNCWYSCNSNEIDARIYDNDENAGSGTVDFGDFYFWGSIDTDVTWSGLVSVGGDVSVPILKNLTILPGTKVRFAAGLDMEEAGIDPALSELVIEGSFHASGTTGEPILFTSDALECVAGDWHGIALNQPTIGAPRHYGRPEFTLTSVLPDRNRQVKARREENRRTLGSVDLEWLVVEYATQGISYCKRGIENLNYSEVRDCSDIGVRVEGENVFLMMDHTDVKRVPVGISCRYDGKVWVENSEITECSTTGIVFAGPYGLVDQTIVENCGTGIWTEHIYGPSIEYSDIMNNEIGVHSAGSSAPGIQRTKILNNSLYGVYITDDARPDLGQFCGYNDLYGNPFNVWNGTDNQILARYNYWGTTLARYNYWGTTNLDTIAAHIWDHNDDPALGVVVFQPIRSNPGSSGSSGGATSGTEMIPLVFKLFQNSPNPFLRMTTIRYSVPREVRVSLKVFDVTGRCVETLVNGERKPGYHEAEFGTKDLGPGVYFAKFEADDYKEIRKLLLMR